MGSARALAVASVPAVAALALRRYRRALDAVSSQPVSVPHMPGSRHLVSSAHGTISYRLVEGTSARDPVVLIHGWGKTADTAWWPLYRRIDQTILAVDLPDHGASTGSRRFSFELAASHVDTAIRHSGIARPILVAHSMGGPVALSLVRRVGPDRFNGLVALATSAYWVRPQLRVILAMAPYAMAPRSPVLLRTARAEFQQSPHIAGHIAWAYTRRPNRHVLDASAAVLRRFDARRWGDIDLPPTLWVVAGQDGILPPDHQIASARHFGATVRVVDAQHSLVVLAPDEIAAVLNAFRPG